MSELLAPAGSFEALRAAIDAGADEVYLGGRKFNARAFANNFDQAQLVKAGELTRTYGVGLHITLNTLVYDREFQALLDYVGFLQKEVAPQAYIVQDLGLAKKLKEAFPDIVLHASTQLRVHSSASASVLKGLGFSRIVLAREMPKEEIASFVQNTDLESEVFVHGALCVCESGGCLMSSMIGHRSGNRGECAQPCRLPYKGQNPYPLSLKDNCLAMHLNELSQMGVTAFKIEGRMKSPDYVYAVTRIYRTLLDERRAPTEREMRALQDVFSRSGFTDGYYTKNVSPSMFGIRSAEDKKKTEKGSVPHTPALYVRKPLQTVPLPFSLPQKDPTRVQSAKEQLGYVARFEGALPHSFAPFADACRIDLPIWKFAKANIRGYERKISLILPRVVFDSEEAQVRSLLEEAYRVGVRHVTVPNLSLLHLCGKFVLHGDYTLNLFNKETLPILEGFSFSSVFLSPEADPKSFGFSTVALEALGYGRLPLMHTETCLIRNILGKCTRCEDCKAVLTDRTNASFPVFRTFKHRNTVYNSVPTYRLDQKKELKKSGVGLLTLLFTTETEEEMCSVCDRYRTASPPTGMTYTRR